MFLIGKWNQKLSDSLFFRDIATAYVSTDGHDGPVFKFPQGEPELGSVVRCDVAWDATLRRGANDHRPRVRRIVRVKAIVAIRGKEYADLRLCAPGEGADAERHGELFLGEHLSLSRNPEATITIFSGEENPLYVQPYWCEDLISE